MSFRKGLAAIAAIALTTGGIGVISGAAVAAEGDRYVPASEVVMTKDSTEESENYNVWHYDPDHNDVASQERNGLLVEAGSMTQIVEGNGNDGAELVDDTSVIELAESLEIVTSHPDMVFYQIPVFFNGDEDGAWDYTTLRKSASSTDNQWISSKSIDYPHGADVVGGQPYELKHISNALNFNGEDARPIAAGFNVLNPGVDVLVSSFSANGETTRFYEEPDAAGSYSGDKEVLVAQQIRPDEEIYAGWHQGYTSTEGTYQTVRDDAGRTAGLKLQGNVQILNGFADDDFIPNAVDLALTLEIDVAEDSGTVWAQVPLFVYEEGVNGAQFTTLRAAVPASGELADAEWFSSRPIVNAAGEVIPANEALDFEDITGVIGDHDVIGYGFLTYGDEATVMSVSFDGVETAFFQDAPQVDGGEEYVPLKDIVMTENPEEESEHYNVWHFDPSSSDDTKSVHNGIIVSKDSRGLIVLGNGNDVHGPRDVLADTTTIRELADSLDVVTSNPAAVHYQIPVFFNHADGKWGFTTLRKAASVETDQWTTSGAIGDIDRNATVDLDEIIDALNEFGDARPIAAGFLVDKPADDVLVSSFKAMDKTTYFYESPAAADEYKGEGGLVESKDIRPNEDEYPGWHEGYADEDLGTFKTLYDGEGDEVAVGLEVDGTVQIINGFEPDDFLQNSIELAESLKIEVGAGTDPVWAQIAVFSYQDGVIGEQFTTIRAEVPASGDMADAEDWYSSQQIKDASGDILLKKDTPYTFDKIAAELGKHEVLSYGFLVWDTTGSVTVNSITFGGVVTSFGNHVSVEPTAPTQDGNTVTIPETEGVDYQVDGETVTGTVEVTFEGEAVVVTAVPTAGYVLEGVAAWTFEYELIKVEAEKPGFDNNTITIPTVDHVTYMIDGEPVSGDLEITKDTTVSAIADPGYALDSDSDTEWTFVYTAKQSTGNLFIIINSWDDLKEDSRFAYGREGDEVLVGDWDGDGYDTVAVRRGKTFYVNNSLSGGNADAEFKYGRDGDEVLVGDWNGDGKDTFAVRRGKTFYVNNSLRGGTADAEFKYGRDGDEVLVGDWNNDGKDTFAVRRDKTFYVNNSLRGGTADAEFKYGRLGDEAFAGDFDGDGRDSISLRRGNVFYLNNSHVGGKAEKSVTYGDAADVLYIGDWDADGIDTIAFNMFVARK